MKMAPILTPACLKGDSIPCRIVRFVPMKAMMSVIETSRGELPQSVRALESLIGETIARDPSSVERLFSAVDDTLHAMREQGLIGDIRFADDLRKIGKRVRFRGSSVGARTLAMSHALRRTIETADLSPWGDHRSEKNWQWPSSETDWTGGAWHKWSFADRQTQAPVTQFTQGMLAMLDDLTDDFGGGANAMVIDAAHDAARAYQPVIGRKYHPDFLRDASQPTVLIAALTLCTARYLQQRAAIPSGALDARGQTLGRLITTLASMSPQGSGWFYGTHGLSSFERPSKANRPVIKCYPTPNPESDRPWQGHKVFVYGPERPGAQSRLHVALDERPQRDDRHCPGVAVSAATADAPPAEITPSHARVNPLAAVALMATLYEAGTTKALTRMPPFPESPTATIDASL